MMLFIESVDWTLVAAAMVISTVGTLLIARALHAGKDRK